MADERNSFSPESRDVRMKGFSRRTTVAATLAWLDQHCHALSAEAVPVTQAAGRVLAKDVSSRFAVPLFPRSMMDGFAVRATDTLGAATYNQLSLRVIGESLPGRGFLGQVAVGEAVRIMTGAPLPSGANAVLPAEKVVGEGELIYAIDEVPPEKNVGPVGEDIAQGTLVLRAGRYLRPQDLGVLSSIGEGVVQVVRRPRVRIVVTGNELLPPGSTPHDFQIVDANSPMLAALIERDGGVPLNPGIVADEPTAILAAMREDVDVIVVSGGSSVGKEDYAPMLLAEHGELAIHGIAMRPSSPTGLGRIGERLVFLLPGNPVSCLCAYDFFAGRAIRQLGGLSGDWPHVQLRRPLVRKLVSAVGRVDYARVKLTSDGVEPLAISGASILSSTTRADGFVIIPEDLEGYPAGTMVEVFLY